MRAGTALLTSGDREAGLAASRFLATSGYRVISITSRPFPPGTRSRYAAANYVLPEADPAQFEARMLELIETIRPDVFVPLGSAAAFIASKHRDRLKAVAGLNVPPMDAFMAAYDKDKCLAECRALGIPCPAEYSMGEATALLERDPTATLVVKPARDVGSAKGVTYVHTRDELSTAVRECAGQFDTALIQEYVPGGVEAMKTIVMMYSQESTLVAAFTMRKRRQWPESGGRTAVSESTADERLLRQMQPFFEKWKWCGPAEVELKTDPATGEDKVIEINPRLPGYLRFLCDSGLGLPALASGAARHAHIDPLPFPSYPVGARYYNPMLVLQLLAASARTNRGFTAALTEMTHALPAAAILLTDPMPWLGKALAGFRAPPDAPLSW